MNCPAKINLGLRVHHRRPSDGYHYITSIFLPISFGDSLEVEPITDKSSKDSLRSTLELPPESAEDYLKVSETGELSKNILWKLLEETRPLRNGEALRLHLTKRIPTGGGLGGGSSNAGTLLLYMGRRYGIPKARLYELACKAGADVPFFLEGSACLVSGTGESCKRILVGAGLGVLAISGIRVNTKEAYRLLKRTLQSAPPPKTMQGLDSKALVALQKSNWQGLRHLVNDFEPPVFELHPELRALKEAFLDGKAELALMSGSGSVVYALVSSKAEQETLVQAMQERFPGYRFVPFGFTSSNGSRDAHIAE